MVIARTTALPEISRRDVVGCAALPPDVRKVRGPQRGSPAGVPISDLPKMPLFSFWGYAPNSLGHSPKFGSNCPAAGGAKPPPHIGQLSREMP